jgi:hypothetical protein
MVESIYFLKPAWCGTHFAGLWPEQGLQPVTRATALRRWFVTQRLHDVLYDPAMKLGLFGIFCALELYGTIRPEDCPPMNGRIAKALRFLGFDVRGT